MMILKCALIDDEPLALDLLESYVKKTPFLQLVGRYSSAVAALGDIRDKQIDLLFLDIQMPELSGLEFSKMVPEHTRIIFTTAFSQYAIDGYRVNALDYLLKPIGYTDFLEAAGKAVKWFEMKQSSATAEEPHTPNAVPPATGPEKPIDCIYVKSEYKLVQVELKDILYIEGLKDYIKIYTEKEPRPILSLISMKMMEQRLPSEQFIRVHRSFIVQKSKIRIIERGRIVFGNTYIPVSDSYKQEWMNFLNDRAF